MNVIDIDDPMDSYDCNLRAMAFWTSLSFIAVL